MSRPIPARIRDLFFYIDGLRYSFEMAKLALSRLRETLEEIASKHDNQKGFKAEEISAFLDAWVVVDMCHRVRELVQQTPGLSQKEPQIQIMSSVGFRKSNPRCKCPNVFH